MTCDNLDVPESSTRITEGQYKGLDCDWYWLVNGWLCSWFIVLNGLFVCRL